MISHDAIPDEAYEAVAWITRVLGSAGIAYQVVGGLAARAFGSKRPLNDIDLYVAADDMEKAFEITRGHCVQEPTHHRDSEWDLTFMKLEYDSQRIEIASADTARLFDGRCGDWVAAAIDFETSEQLQLGDLTVSVMPLDQLREYKAALGREVDRCDLLDLAGDP